MDDFCREKGIKREYIVARTPQQNGMAERRNMTLIEAARTMLVDSKLPTTFWAEAVSTACYGTQGKLKEQGTSKDISQDCIMMPIWKDVSYFDSPAKDVDNGEPKTAADAQKMLILLDNMLILLQVTTEGRRNIISQDKYVAEILKKFNYTDVKSASTPVDLKKPVVKDKDADDESTTGGCQFLGNRLISWQCKKQTVVATSTTEAEYVAAASCCGQVLWIQNQLLDYGYNFMNTVINIDNNNLLTKGFDAGRFQYLVSKSKASRDVKRGWDTKIPQSSGPNEKGCDEAIHKELGDRMERAATTASSLEAEHDSGSDLRCQDTILGDVDAQTRFEITSKQSNDSPLSSPKFAETHNVVAFFEKPEESDRFAEIIDFLEASSVHYALTVNPVIYTSCIEQFWATAKVQTVNGVRQLQALVDKKMVIVTESSIRKDLHLDDAEGTDCLLTATIFEERARIG
ncbi:putative ribonuclease H-like domain-containing protein, partial [Tanacetum coccineum]